MDWAVFIDHCPAALFSFPGTTWGRRVDKGYVSCNQLLLIVSATYVLIKIVLLVINVAMALNDVIDMGTVRVKPYLEYKMQIKLNMIVDIDYSEVHVYI